MDQITSTITSGSRDWTKYYGRGTGTFVMAQNVRPGKLDLSFRQPVDPPANNRDRVRSEVIRGDLLVTIVGANTGDVCSVDSDLSEHYVCQSVALMRPVEPAVAAYMNAYFSSPEHGQRQYRRYTYGAGRPHLSFDQIRMLQQRKELLAQGCKTLDEYRICVSDLRLPYETDVNDQGHTIYRWKYGRLETLQIVLIEKKNGNITQINLTIEMADSDQRMLGFLYIGLLANAMASQDYGEEDFRMIGGWLIENAHTEGAMKGLPGGVLIRIEKVVRDPTGHYALVTMY